MDSDEPAPTPISCPGSVGVRVRVPSASPGVLLRSVGAPAPCARSRRLASRSRGPQPEPQRDLDSYGRSRMSPDAAPLATWVNDTQANVHGREEVVWGQGLAGRGSVGSTRTADLGRRTSADRGGFFTARPALGAAAGTGAALEHPISSVGGAGLADVVAHGRLQPG